MARLSKRPRPTSSLPTPKVPAPRTSLASSSRARATLRTFHARWMRNSLSSLTKQGETMRKSRISAVAAMAAAAALALTGCGGSGGDTGDGGDTVKIGIKFDQPGLGFKEGEAYKGFDVDVAKYVAKELGFAEDKIEWVSAPSANRETLLET